MTRRAQWIGAAMLALLAAAGARRAAVRARLAVRSSMPISPTRRRCASALVHEGQLQRPFVYPVHVVDRLERRFEADTSAPAPIRFFSNGRLVTSDAAWFLLGADPLGRDVLSRILHGGRLSLSVAAFAVLFTLLIGALIGAVAGYAGGRVDRVLMALSDFIVILPTAYVLLTLRASMPLHLSTAAVFWTMVGVMAAVSWPLPARGVRAIVAAERKQAYAEAAYAAGAGPLRILLRHLLPAAAGHLATQAFLLFPAFILAEATLSFLGLGFAEPSASWGVMLQDSARVATIVEAPWLMTPAIAVVFAVFATHLVTRDESPRT